jgi:hypothetical protein
VNGTESTSCTLTEDITVGGKQTTLTLCTEASGLTPDDVTALNMTCAPDTVPDAGIRITGTSSASCPTANRVGGCSVMTGGYSQTQWYYVGGSRTADELQMSCSQAGGTFVAP